MKSILVLNLGSSSIKFAVFEIDKKELKKTYTGIVDRVLHNPILHIKSPDKLTIELSHITKNAQYADPYERAVRDVLDWLNEHDVQIVAAGHRMIHGGTKNRYARPIDDEVIALLETFIPLAPLHQPYNIKGAQILREIYPKLFQVACFDSSFHTTWDNVTQHIALPKRLYEEGIRGYGFHGLSYEYIVSQFDKVLPPDKVNGKFIIAHLGAGASLCAVSNKKSIGSTLSFSALGGLPMGTRCGDLDPGIILYLMETQNIDYKTLWNLLYKESGLLGLSNGISSDMRELEASDSPDARLAIEVFVDKISSWIGALTAKLQGLDGLIFTAGIGENSVLIREKVCEKAKWLGARLDREKNRRNDTILHESGSALLIYRIPTDEELMIAQQTLNLIGDRPPSKTRPQ